MKEKGRAARRETAPSNAREGRCRGNRFGGPEPRHPTVGADPRAASRIGCEVMCPGPFRYGVGVGHLLHLGSPCTTVCSIERSDLDEVAGDDPTVGHWMAPDSRWGGLLSEALHALLDVGLSTAPHGLGLGRTGWHAYAGSSASARVAQKAWFRFEGTLRDGAAGREDCGGWLGCVGLEDGRVESIQRQDSRMAHPGTHCRASGRSYAPGENR